MATGSDLQETTWLRWSTKSLPYAAGVWLVTSLILAIPHGEGHSISSDFELVTMLRSIAFDVGVVAVLGIAVALMLQVLRRERRL